MNLESPQCTNRCCSVQHGNIITAAITKRGVTDLDLSCYLNYICANCADVKDSEGRTALHVAASRGRVGLVRWLIHNRHANINLRDKESGCTPLHRSIFYGKINVAVELMKQGANLEIYDYNNLTALEHAMKDSPKPNLNFGELYVWGCNTNNTFGPQQARTHPELLDVFHKEYPMETVQQICLDKFHTVIVASSGRVYSSGHGQGGRLGLGIQHSVITPTLIQFPEQVEKLFCIEASVSRDHSLFLMSDNNVYSCGLNVNKVLGIEPQPEKALKPTPIRHLGGISGLCSGQYHSVAWGPKCLYTWGLNAGQLGHKLEGADKYIVRPKKVKVVNFEDNCIRGVSASNGATTFCTAKGDIYVLHEYLCRKIASRQLNVVRLSIVGGKLNSSLDKELTESNRELKVVALTNTGNLLLWQESDPQLCRCIFSINRAIVVKQALININGISFISQDGEAFHGTIRPRKHKTLNNKTDKNSAFHKFLDREDCVCLKISKVPRIHRAVSIQADVKGHDYCVIQQSPYKNFKFPEIEKSEMQEHFSILLNDALENDDIHDVVFKVKNQYFPAHRFICATRSPHLEKVLMDCSNEIVEIADCQPEIFELFLTYLYTATCDLIKPGECAEKLRKFCEPPKVEGENNRDVLDVDENLSAFEVNAKTRNQNQEPKTVKNPVRLLQDLVKRMGCGDLQKVLANMSMQKYCVKIKNSAVECKLNDLKFSRDSLQEYYDVNVKCSDGKTLKAHKCVLAARMEYFNNMFSTRWNESDTSLITLPFPITIVEALLEYLYTDTLSSLANKEMDHLFKVLVLADQLFVNRLKEQCEFLLTNLLTLKNCIQLLSFSNIYNADKLKHCCLKFIIYNITPILEMGILEDLDADLLKELSGFYFEHKEEVWCREITPYSTAPPDEIILSISSAFPISLDVECEKVVTKSQPKRRSRTHKQNTSLKENSKVEEKENCDNIIQFPDTDGEDGKSCQSNAVVERLNAIKLAQEVIADEPIEPQYTKLNNETSFDDDFPILNSPPSSFSKSPNKNEYGSGSRHKIVKISQKQRKRLSSESAVEIVAESPKNPWKIVNIDNGSPKTPPANFNIQDIISSERKQKENLVKIKSKSLVYTQIEDKAIDDLHRFYNSGNNFDEIISVHRVEIGAIASPVWVQNKKLLEAL